VDHLLGHICASWLEPIALDPPFVSLIASGGHTRLDLVRDLAHPETLGQTIDDAAGEALDKGARLLGLGYPGGPALERLSRGGDPTAHAFPVALGGRRTRDFSFAGVKTSLLYVIRREGDLSDGRRADLASSYQEAIVAPLAARLLDAAREHRAPAIALGGGVAANGRLRELVSEGAAQAGLRVAMPEIALCTDNAAMIGAAAQFTEPVAWPDFLAMDAMPTTPPGGIAA
jgi:N6-L-threonylcarbamoyladenine synthase